MLKQFALVYAQWRRASRVIIVHNPVRILQIEIIIFFALKIPETFFPKALMRTGSMHLYVIRDSNSVDNILKLFGIHKGDKKKLVKRYTTILPNMELLLFVPLQQAQTCEKLILTLLTEYRVHNVNGNKSEWLQIPFGNLKRIIHDTILSIEKLNSLNLAKVSQNGKNLKRKRFHIVQDQHKLEMDKNKQEDIILLANEDAKKNDFENFQMIIQSTKAESPGRAEKEINPGCNPTWQELSEYVQMIMKMNVELAVAPLFQGLLLELLWISIHGKDFHVQLDDIVAVMKKHRIYKQKVHLKRQLVHLRDGVDFKKTQGKRSGLHGGSTPILYWLTIPTFQRICLRAHTPIRQPLERYFLFTEKQYREKALQVIQRRQILQDAIPFVEMKSHDLTNKKGE